MTVIMMITMKIAMLSLCDGNDDVGDYGNVDDGILCVILSIFPCRHMSKAVTSCMFSVPILSVA